MPWKHAVPTAQAAGIASKEHANQEKAGSIASDRQPGNQQNSCPFLEAQCEPSLATAGGRPPTKHHASNMESTQPWDDKMEGRVMHQLAALAPMRHRDIPMNMCAPTVSDSEKMCATTYQANQDIRTACKSSQSKMAAPALTTMVVRVRPGPPNVKHRLLYYGKTPKYRETRKSCHAKTRLHMEALLPYASVANAQPRPSSRSAKGAPDAHAEERPKNGKSRLRKVCVMQLSASRHLVMSLALKETRHAAARHSPL